MKKSFFGLLILLLFTFALTSCGEANDDAVDETVSEIAGEMVYDTYDDTVDEALAEVVGNVTDEGVSEVEYIRITPQQAQDMMQNYDVIVLDVRTSEEFNEGHIPNAVLLPDFEVRESASGVLGDKSQIILVYCRSGRRSESAARILIDLGYTRVYDFGGIIDWDGDIVS